MNSEQKSSSGMLEQEIFVGALAKTNTDTRAAFLDAACGEDNKLRDRIEALLREQAKAGDFLEANWRRRLRSSVHGRAGGTGSPPRGAQGD